MGIADPGGLWSGGFNQICSTGGSVFFKVCKKKKKTVIKTFFFFFLISHVFVPSRIYERVVEPPYMDIPEGASFWLGQRNAAHGFFKVSAAAPRPFPSSALSPCAISDSEWLVRLSGGLVMWLHPMSSAALLLGLFGFYLSSLWDLIACIAQALLF